MPIYDRYHATRPDRARSRPGSVESERLQPLRDRTRPCPNRIALSRHTCARGGPHIMPDMGGHLLYAVAWEVSMSVMNSTRLSVIDLRT